MSKLFAVSFEGGAYPDTVTVNTGTPRPYSGYSQDYWKWALVGSMSTNQQASATFALGASKTSIWSSFRFKADVLEFTTPSPLFEFGAVSLTLTSATNLRLTYNATNVDYTITAAGSAWHFIGIYATLSGTVNPGINVTYDGDIIAAFNIDTSGGAIGGSASTVTIRGPRGTGSAIDDVRIDDSGTVSFAPAEIEGHKSLPQGVAFTQWSEKGIPSNASVGITVQHLAYHLGTGLFYGVDASSNFRSVDPRTFASTVISAESTANQAACVYHKSNNKIYFIANNVMREYNGSTVANTAGGTTCYFSGTSVYATGSAYDDVQKKAYIVTLTAGSGTGNNVVNVHIIDSTGAVTVVSNGVGNTAAVNAIATNTLPVYFDTINNVLVFPLFTRNCVGQVDSSNVLSYSGTVASTTITWLCPAPALMTQGKFLAIGYTGTATTPTNHVMLQFSVDAGFSQYTSTTGTLFNTNGDPYGRGLVEGALCYHPYLGKAYWRKYNDTGLVETLRSGQYNIRVLSGAMPSATTVFTGKINPLTGGVFVIDGGILKELRVLSVTGERNVQVLDRAFIEQAVSGQSFSPLMSDVIPGATIHASNIVCNDATGRGSIDVISADSATVVKGLSATKKNICVMAYSALPEYRYVFTDLPSLVSVGSATLYQSIPHKGTASSSMSGYTNTGYFPISMDASSGLGNYSINRTTYMSAVIPGGGGYGYIAFSTAGQTISGDFTCRLITTTLGIGGPYSERAAMLQLSTNYFLRPDRASINSNYILLGQSALPTEIVFGRRSGVFYLYMAGQLLGSYSDSSSFALNSIIRVGSLGGDLGTGMTQYMSLVEIYTTRWVGINGTTIGNTTPFRIAKD